MEENMLLAREIDLTAGTGVVAHLVPNPKIYQCPRKDDLPTKILIDWSGNEMNAEEYAGFLSKWKTGAHLFIDHEGRLWQFVDLGNQVRRHPAGDVGGIWIVLQNKGAPPEDPRVRRGTFRITREGQTYSVLCATTAQIETLEELVVLLCESFRIEPRLPRVDGEATHPECSAIPPALFSTRALEDWEGVLLAMHLDGRTLSPGPGILQALDELEQIWDTEEEEDEDDTDFEGEEQEIDEDAFDAAFPDP